MTSAPFGSVSTSAFVAPTHLEMSGIAVPYDTGYAQDGQQFYVSGWASLTANSHTIFSVSPAIFWMFQWMLRAI